MIKFFVKYRVLVSIVFYVLLGSDFLLTSLMGLSEEQAEIFNWISRIILFIFWLIILFDMIRNKIQNKTFWIISMFILVIFSPVVYLFRRNMLLHLQNNKFRNV